MAKVLGKIPEETMKLLTNIQTEIANLKNQLEYLTLKAENVGLKINVKELERSKILTELKHEFKIDDISSVKIKDSGEVIDIKS